jgi:eukaryotic-like serine/threonine-protein kinase
MRTPSSPPRITPTTLPEERETAVSTVAPAPTSLADERYVIEREIAQGGMGRVFTGRDRRLGRPVAVKVLLDRNPALARRFEREARVAARLQHPAIVTVYDAGFWPTGEPYLVMKHVLGRSLEKVISEAETLEDRLALLPHVITAADALAYAHDQGIVHRDLKPSNVIVGAFGETVVIDWGLAKDLRLDEADEPLPEAPARQGELTQAGAVLGTPAYMAPEQAAGHAITARADVYALGAMLYHTLAGHPPGPRTPAEGHEKTPAPPPLARVEPRAPADLAAIVAQAMAPDPHHRYPSAFELAEDLKRFQTGQLVAARRYPLAVRVARWARQRRWAVLAGIAAAAALAARQCG